jgi:hypothetical protein
LKVAYGPGIEWLEYLCPRNGRTLPVDEKSIGLIHWQTQLVTLDIQAVSNSLEGKNRRFVPPGIVPCKEKALEFGKAFFVRDPDGRAMELTER